MQISKFRTLVILSVLACPAFVGCGNDNVFAPESPVGSDLSANAVSGRVRRERVTRTVIQLPYEQQASVAECSGFDVEPPTLSPNASLSETIRYTDEVTSWQGQFQAYINGLSLSELMVVTDCVANPPDRVSTPDVNAYTAQQLAILADCAGYAVPPIVNANASLSVLVSQTEAYNAWRTGFVTYINSLPLQRLVEYTGCAKAKEQVIQA